MPVVTLDNLAARRAYQKASDGSKLTPEEEASIAESPVYSYSYALNVLKAPFPLGEPVMAKSPVKAYVYATEVLKAPFPSGGEAILQDQDISFKYARDVLGDYNPRTWRDRKIRSRNKSTLRGTWNPFENMYGDQDVLAIRGTEQDGQSSQGTSGFECI